MMGLHLLGCAFVLSSESDVAVGCCLGAGSYVGEMVWKLGAFGVSGHNWWSIGWFEPRGLVVIDSYLPSC